MEDYRVRRIGTAGSEGNPFCMKVDAPYIKGLTGLEGFSHVMILWWANQLDMEDYREIIEIPRPYKKGPEIMGVFATRSPMRPNPIGVSICQVERIDYVDGILYLSYIDADPGTPILDIKPYTPSADCTQYIEVPEWCSHWPKTMEESGEFNWEDEFEF